MATIFYKVILICIVLLIANNFISQVQLTTTLNQNKNFLDSPLKQSYVKSNTKLDHFYNNLNNLSKIHLELFSQKFNYFNSSKTFFKRKKRNSSSKQFHLNNELNLNIGNIHESFPNTFQSGVWTQEYNRLGLTDEEALSDIEMPESIDEDENDDLEDVNNNKNINENLFNKNADYEENKYVSGQTHKIIHHKNKHRKNRKKFKHIQNKNTSSSMNEASNLISASNTSLVNDAQSTNATILKDKQQNFKNDYIELISGPGNLTALAGENIILYCIFEAKPSFKVKWFKNEAPLERNLLNKYKLRLKLLSDNKYQARLIINQLDTHDKGFYQCRANNGKLKTAESLGVLMVINNNVNRNRDTFLDETKLNGLDSSTILQRSSSNNIINDHNDLINMVGHDLINGVYNGVGNPSSDTSFNMQDQDSTHFTLDSLNSPDFDHNYLDLNSNNFYGRQANNGLQCVPYIGTVCSQYLRNRTILLPSLNQIKVEQMLQKAFTLISNSASVSPSCYRFIAPLFCYRSFHVCENQNNQFHYSASSLTLPKLLNQFNIQLNNKENLQENNHLAAIAHHLQQNPLQQKYSGFLSYLNSIKKSSIGIRQLCRDECELLEYDICSLEFNLAISNPNNLKLLLPNCDELPKVGTVQHENCLRIGVYHDLFSSFTNNNKCYLDKGETYRGNINITKAGKNCEIWSTITTPNTLQPELSGSHNFCRNPKRSMEGPWCYVKDETQKTHKELCRIPKCDDHFWIYYIFTPLLSIFTLIILIGIIYCIKRYQLNKSNSMVNGICISANDLFQQQFNYPLQEQQILQTNCQNLNTNNIQTNGFRVPLSYLNQNSNSSSKCSNYNLLSNVLASVTSIKNNDLNFNKKKDAKYHNIESVHNIELKSLLSTAESSSTFPHHALNSNLPINITNNPTATNLIHYPLNRVRILTRIYPRVNLSDSLKSLSNIQNCSNKLNTHLKSSLNYQFYAGQLTNSSNAIIQNVVIRALKLISDIQNVNLFLEQAAELNNLLHPNLIRLLGIAIGSNNHSTIPQHFLIFEQFSSLNLLNFLQQQSLPNKLIQNNDTSYTQKQLNLNLDCSLEYCDLLQIAQQIAFGMQYLSEHNYVHGDLAARSCFVNVVNMNSNSNAQRIQIKIGNLKLQNILFSSSNEFLNNLNQNKNKKKSINEQFELKEEIIEEQLDDFDYFTINVKHKALAVRWLSPETLLSLQFSLASDIWSYGVTLWEIFTFGRQIPFELYTNTQVVDLIVAGRLLDCPVYCEPPLHALMLDCWREIPSQRVSFGELVRRLTTLISNCTNNSSSSRNWTNNLQNDLNIQTNNTVNNLTRICSPVPNNMRINLKKTSSREDKVDGWLNSEFNHNNHSPSFLCINNKINSNSINQLTNINNNNTWNSSSTYASSYCNQINSTNFNTQNNVEYDQPFVSLKNSETNNYQKNKSNIKSTKSTNTPTNTSIKNINSKINFQLNSSSKIITKNKQEDCYENHYAKLTYEDEECDSSFSSNF